MTLNVSAHAPVLALGPTCPLQQVCLYSPSQVQWVFTSALKVTEYLFSLGLNPGPYSFQANTTTESHPQPFNNDSFVLLLLSCNKEKKKIRRALAKFTGPSAAAALLPYPCTTKGLGEDLLQFVEKKPTSGYELLPLYLQLPGTLHSLTRLHTGPSIWLTVLAEFLPPSSHVCPRSLLTGICPSLNI